MVETWIIPFNWQSEGEIYEPSNASLTTSFTSNRAYVCIQTGVILEEPSLLLRVYSYMTVS